MERNLSNPDIIGPLVGLAADRFGIERTLVGMAFIPLVAALLALPLPRTGTNVAE